MSTDSSRRTLSLSDRQKVCHVALFGCRDGGDESDFVAPDTVFNIATATTDPFSTTTVASPPSSTIEQPRTTTLPPKSLPCSSPGNTTYSISPTPALPSPVSSAGRCSRAHPKRIENGSDGLGEGGEMVNNVSRSPTESVIGRSLVRSPIFSAVLILM